MKQQQFQAEQSRTWEIYRRLLAQLEKAPRGSDGKSDLYLFPALYRRICAHYALARTRRYSPGLTEDLQNLVGRGYPYLHRRRPSWSRRTLAFFVADFPRTLRRHRKLFALSVLLFFAPILAMAIACYQDSELIYSLLDNEQVFNLESMYDPTNRLPGREASRQADTDFAMFGFYVINNVGVAFRTFAGGLIIGIGSLFFLVFNGLVIGAAAGHITALGYGEIFWSFVSGHSSLELTAIAIAGSAGLLLAAALLVPGRRRRGDALRRNAVEAVKLAMGALAMLVLAALVEAFWSSGTRTDPLIKYLFGGFWWLLVILYFMYAGRGGGDAA
ncbi:MAG: stage II sporulation protein M [Chromatiaceae bacterium]|jgi:uncharacterized membrane protein SpoIIM required for sporulation|nr:stage II sporulation protein M [Chromatiaceae bacterium]